MRQKIPIAVYICCCRIGTWNPTLYLYCKHFSEMKITLSTSMYAVTAWDHSMCLFMLFIKLIVLQHYPQCSPVFSFSPPRLQILVPVYQLHKCQALSIFGIFWHFPNIYKSWLTFLSQLIPSTQIIIYYIEIFWPRKSFLDFLGHLFY